LAASDGDAASGCSDRRVFALPLTKVAYARIRRREPLAATERAGGDSPMAEVAGVTGLRYWKCLI
jgi:hypothetical protein